MNDRQLTDFGRTARPELKVLFITRLKETSWAGIGWRPDMNSDQTLRMEGLAATRPMEQKFRSAVEPT
jgi:hypothetical protein